MNDWLDKSLQDLAAEDPPVEAVAEVRMRVLDRVKPRRRWWLWLLAPATAAVVVSLLVLPEPAARSQRARDELARLLPEKQFEAPAAATPKAAATAEPAEAIRPVVPQPRRRVAKAVTLDAQAAEQSIREDPSRVTRTEMAQARTLNILPTGTPDFVRIESGNPNVVILWSMNLPVTEQSGDRP